MKEYITSINLLFVILFLIFSCSDDLLIEVCPDGKCYANINFSDNPDDNGFYHVKLDWTREYYPYFFIDIEASPTNPEFYYNDTPVVSARFDSDTYWVIGDTLSVRQAYYQPFESYYTSTSGPLPTEINDLLLTQFSGIKVNVAQPTSVYFSKYGNKMTTRRGLGPFPPFMKGDTIKLYMEVFWDAGDNSIVKDDYTEKFIVE